MRGARVAKWLHTEPGDQRRVLLGREVTLWPGAEWVRCGAARNFSTHWPRGHTRRERQRPTQPHSSCPPCWNVLSCSALGRRDWRCSALSWSGIHAPPPFPPLPLVRRRRKTASARRRLVGAVRRRPSGASEPRADSPILERRDRVLLQSPGPGAAGGT